MTSFQQCLFVVALRCSDSIIEEFVNVSRKRIGKRVEWIRELFNGIKCFQFFANRVQLFVDLGNSFHVYIQFDT